MLRTTGRLIGTWLRLTLLLGVLVLITGWAWRFDSTPFIIAVATAVVIELVALRGLARKWVFDARGHWWWL